MDRPLVCFCVILPGTCIETGTGKHTSSTCALYMNVPGTFQPLFQPLNSRRRPLNPSRAQIGAVQEF